MNTLLQKMRRPRWIWICGLVGLGAILLSGYVLFLRPYLQVRALAIGVASKGGLRMVFDVRLHRDLRNAIASLGGPERASRQASRYLGLPRRLAPNRDSVVFLLLFCGESGAHELVRLLNDEDPNVRGMAAIALSASGKVSRDAVGPLITVMENNPGEAADAFMIPFLAIALGRSGDARVVPPLIAMLKSGDGSVREAAAEALGYTKDPRAVSELILGLEDVDGDVRCKCALALGEIGDKQAVVSLQRVSASGDPALRSAAVTALARLGIPTVPGPGSPQPSGGEAPRKPKPGD